MFLPQMDVEDAISTVVSAMHPRFSNGVMALSLVLTDQERAEDVHLSLAFERTSNHTKVLSSRLSEEPLNPVYIDLWGLEADHDSGWTSGVRIALARALAWLESKANTEDGELDINEVTARFNVFNIPQVYRYAKMEPHSENIYKIGWFHEVSS